MLCSFSKLKDLHLLLLVASAAFLRLQCFLCLAAADRLFSHRGTMDPVMVNDLIDGIVSGVCPGGELDLPECVTEDRWLQLSSVERTIYNRTFNALESSVRQSGLLRARNRAALEGSSKKFNS